MGGIPYSIFHNIPCFLAIPYSIFQFHFFVKIWNKNGILKIFTLTLNSPRSSPIRGNF
jgi:hypothetical protein